MSSKCSAAVFDRYPGGAGEFALALALADNAHEDGTHIFPSVETMARKSRQSVRAVQSHLRKMQQIGWLELVKNGRGGRGRYAEYRINAAWLKGAELAPFSEAAGSVDNFAKGADVAPFAEIKGAKLGTKRVQPEAQKGANQSTPYITDITPTEPITPLPPTGGESPPAASKAKPEARSGTVDQEDLTAGFDEFWLAWPDNENRQDYALCLARWRRKKLYRFTDVIVADVEARKESRKWKDGYIEAPAKYLKGSRWMDRPGNSVQTSALCWDDSVAGVHAMAAQLGLEPWDKGALERTHDQSDMFHVFAKRVRDEFDRRNNGAN